MDGDYMRNIDTRTREMIYPIRIVKTYGCVEHSENLLLERDLQITTSEPNCIHLENKESPPNLCFLNLSFLLVRFFI